MSEIQLTGKRFNWLVASLLILAVFLLPTHFVSAANNVETPTNIGELKAKIIKLIEESSVPGAAVTVIEDNTVELSEGFGFAKLDGEIPMTNSTLLRVGSLSKNLTTLAAMSLMDQGKLDIDQPISVLAPKVIIHNPWAEKHPITLRHLLGHTAGLEGSSYYEYATSEANVSPREYADEIAPKVKVRWQPGQFFTYANPGHTIAAVAIENACQCEFDNYLEKTIFAELGMRDSSFRYTDELARKLAASYDGDGTREQADWLMPIRPSGSLISTADDLARLIQFYAAPRGGESRLVSDNALTQMEKTQASAAGALGVNSTGYGLGTFAFSPGDGKVLYGHSGSTEGFKTWLGYRPGGGAGFAVVINGDDSGLRWRLTALLGKYITRNVPPESKAPAVELDGETATAYSGWYAPFTHDMTLRAGLVHILGAVKVDAQDSGLRVSPIAPNLPASELIPVSKNTFREGD